MEPLKEQFFSLKFYQQLSDEINTHTKAFNSESFLKEAAESIDTLELKQRLNLTSALLKKYLELDYTETLAVLYKVAPKIRGFSGIVFPSYVEMFGIDQPEESVQALKYLTQFSTSEFAIRPFIVQYPEETLKEISTWTKEDNHHVRRLASEGTRPKLPWAAKLKIIEENPALVKPILFDLQKDESLYVRKSVGNHLNDLTKINSELVLQWIAEWDKSHEHSFWIINRALRSLIKEGHPQTLKYLGIAKPEISNLKFSTSKKELAIGDSLNIELSLELKKPTDLIIDFVVYYAGKNGLRKKVFKWKNLTSVANVHLEKKIVLQHFSTRTIYSGEHFVSVQVNGIEMEKTGFLVKE